MRKAANRIVINGIKLDHGGLANAFGTCNHVIGENAYYLPDTITDWIVFDVGANIGSFSLLAAQRGARVFSFEPFPTNYKMLVKNIRLNKLEDRITAFPLAIGVPGDQELFFHPVRKDWCSLDSSLNELAGAEHLRVTVISLEQAIKLSGVDHISFLKLDCEGAERPIFTELVGGLHELVSHLSGEFHYGPDDTTRQLRELSPYFGLVHSSSSYEHLLIHV